MDTVVSTLQTKNIHNISILKSLFACVVSTLQTKNIHNHQEKGD